MHSGFISIKRCLTALWVATATIVLPSAAQVSSTSGLAGASDRRPTSVLSSLLDEGRSLEADQRWGDALAHYEQALRDHPDDGLLRQRFDNARLHYSLDRRLGDRSFRASAAQLSPQLALDLYGELLLKINTHYVDNPPWQQLVHRGALSLDTALANSSFRAQNGVNITEVQRSHLRQEIQTLLSRSAIQTRQDAANVASETAQIVAYRTGLRHNVTLLEFAAAAAEGLDGYSAFLTPDQLRDVYSQIEGNFVGLGVELKADDGALLIVHVIPHSPAERSGIQAGDRIVAVDGKATRELSTDEAASLLTGEEGSQVQVTLVRFGRTARTISVRREHVDVPSLEDAQIIDRQHGVAYVRIPAFQKTTAQDLEETLWQLHREGMRSLVIDVRGNPGGLLTASVEVADKFVAGGPIVSTQGRSAAENFDYRAHRAGTWRVPLVVLIDGESASASEIFAAAIKDSRRGTIIGTRSFGKGSVQGIFPLGRAGAGIRLTTAKFFSPQGRPISKVGVYPDIDTRRATLAADGSVDQAINDSHLVAFRGVERGEGVETNFDDPHDPESRDSDLETAVSVARELPTPVL